MSKDNFKDEFERNRQEINPTRQNHTPIEEESSKQTDALSTDSTQHFPPRNTARRHRKRVRNQESTSDNATKQEVSQQNHADKETPSQQNTNQQSAVAGANDVDKQTPKTSKRNATPSDDHRSRDGKAAISSSVAGVAASSDKSTNQQQVKQSTDSKSEASAQTTQTQSDKQATSNNKKAASVGAGVATGTAASSSAKAANHTTATQAKEETSKTTATSTAAGTAGVGTAKTVEQPSTTVSNGADDGGILKRFLPIIAAILLLGTIAIFGGMYLFNQDQGTSNDDAQLTQQTSSSDKKAQSEKDKAEKEKAQKEKTQKEKTAKEKAEKEKAEKEKAEKEKAEQEAAQNDVANQQDLNNQYAAQNQQQQPNAGNQSHTVAGNENLYRIAIQYYGSGSPENVEKIRQANGISGNNISNGQQLIIP
ncbi:LysM peptidoglycan-binding domain-containing protein [Staphylococcus americanisciuri]|uniref:LysM peptidoglycan-binding domain-containing protein n=1 Tax=Staphylococcus americanisciuri TaxID=2973940 RepID=A0ABT2EZ12_9STAP|nr:LysM peptidoglycan-binding domain-containing protein [Staphylococcus americanisciuri]MCS4485470.1 LysM peptidoglycan-binding domain-containing protein [Staphylococcus americanisciuri]